VNTFRVLDEGRFCDDESSSGKVSEDAWDYSGFACDATQVFHDDMLEGKPVSCAGLIRKRFGRFNLVLAKIQTRFSMEDGS